MEITVNEAQGLPEKAVLSIRVADARRQVQYKPGECFQFEPQKVPKHFVVDVFQKIGTKQVSLLELKDIGKRRNEKMEVSEASQGIVEVPHTDGVNSMKLDLKVQIKEQDATDGKAKRTSRHQSALKAKSYLDNCNVQRLLQGMVHSLLTTQPDNAIDFMTNYLKEHKDECPHGSLTPSPFKVDKPPLTPLELKSVELPPLKELEPRDLKPVLAEEGEAPLPDYASKPGLGESEPTGRFAADGSLPLPDLSGHHSILASVLRKSPQVYEQLKDVQTSLGVSLAKCIKTGVDNRGHKMIRTVGLVAGDEHCYQTFRDVFDPVILAWHKQESLPSSHPQDLDSSKVSDEPLDASGKYIVAGEVRVSRSLSGLRMPTAIEREERREAERVIVKALLELGDDFKGSYHPLRGSRSYVPKDQGMDVAKERLLRSQNLLFEEPDAAVVLSSGFGRHWPDGRGIFATDDHQFAVWINEMEHLRICCRAQGDKLQEVFGRCARVEAALQEALRRQGHNFARSDSLGFLAACPSNLGTGLDMGVTLRLPLLSKRSDFKAFCRSLDLNARIVTEAELLASNASSGDLASGDYWRVSSITCFGISEVDQVNTVLGGCRVIVALEARLEAGEDLETLDEAMQAVPPGLGDDYPGFSADECPEEMPDLSTKHSMAAQVLREDPGIYARLRHKRTALGVSFARCIKTAIDNNGHRMIKTTGLVAGDDECYETFRELFDPVIALRFPSYDPACDQPIDNDLSKLSSVPLELPGCSQRVVSVRVRASRNLSGFRMPPACSREERRKVEQLLAQVLMQGELSDLGGDYFPLVGSGSYTAKPGGMREEDEQQLRDAQLVFDAPDSEVLLSAGYGRHWPDARGIFASSDMSFLGHPPRIAAVVNEEDHLRLEAASLGADLQGAFQRLGSALAAVEAGLQKSGQNFARSQRLGYLGSSPGNLGTCLVAGVMLRLPYLSSRREFRVICRKLGLQAHMGKVASKPSTEGLWEVSNAQRLGSSEVEQVNTVLEGCVRLLEFEQNLEMGETPDFESQLGPLPTPSGPLPLSCSGTLPVTPAADQVFTLPHREDLFHERPGLGSDDLPGFPTDECPLEMPDLARHHSLLADVLKRNPALYAQLRGLRTKLDVTLARCIKTSMDNCGHAMIKTIGAVAGDDECYELFQPLFDAIVRARNKEYNFEEGHKADLDWNKLSDEPLDKLGNSVCLVRVRANRSLHGFRMPPAILQAERREVESLLTSVFSSFADELAGEYFPLAASASFPAKPHGMSSLDEESLHDAGLLFQEPDAALVLASGTGRDWPDARGVFATPSQNLAVWVNEEDHVRLISCQEDGNLKDTFRRFCIAEAALRKGVSDALHDFAWSNRFGYLVTCPGNLGTGMRVEVVVKLPLFGTQKSFRKFCKDLGVQARTAATFGEHAWEISNTDRLGTTEVQQVENVAGAVRRLLAEEAALASPSAEPAPVTTSEAAKEADLRKKAKADLVNAVATGILAAAVAKCKSKEAKTAENPDDARKLANEILEDGSKNGSLQIALQASDPAAASPEATAKAVANPNDVRKKAKAQLLNAKKDGSLQTALQPRGPAVSPEATAPEATAKAVANPNDVRKKAKAQLLNAKKDGSLQTALESLFPAASPEAEAPEATAPEATAPEATAPEASAPEATAKAIANPGDVRKKAKAQLLSAKKDGSLQTALQSRESQAKPVSAPEELTSAEATGLGDKETPGFPADVCPEELPDLSGHHNLMAQVLRREPEIYARLRGQQSEYGTTLAKCIKMGVDCHGHPMIRTMGLIAGDEDCYNVFRDLFDPIIAQRHAQQDGAASHLTDLDVAKVDSEKLDTSGKYVVSCRLRALRNVHGVRFPPAVSAEERREVEGMLVRALSHASGALEGNYLTLNGMTQEQQVDLERDGLLFQEPDAALLLSAGIGRNWPEARGVFSNQAHSIAAWVNNEDHLRLFVTEETDSLQEAFGRFCSFDSSIRDALRQEGRDFAWNERLGFLTSCPSNLGPGGFRISLLMRLPLLGAQSNFKALCRELDLQVRPAQTEAWGMLWSVVGNGKLGVSEAQLVNHMAKSCRKLIEMEVELELGVQK